MSRILEEIEEATSTGSRDEYPSTIDPTALDLSSSSTMGPSSSASIWDKPLVALPSEPDYDLRLSPMLRKYPAFIPLRRQASSIAEVAILVPSSSSNLRKATVMSATFNMISTIIGGSILSIPLSCARAGVVPFTILMLLSAYMTDFSLYILCSCARRTGSTSYGRVAGMAMGLILELLVTIIIFSMLAFIVVGQMVLNQGIWTPIVFAVLNPGTIQQQQEELSSKPMTMSRFQDAIVLMLLLLSMFPFLLMRDLTSLRHFCYVGFCSIAILCFAVAYRAAEKNLRHPSKFPKHVQWAAENFSDVLLALPITLQAFVCSFNMINVHCSLVEPTRERVKEVIHMSVFLSFIVMYVFGLAGYLWAYEHTNGNILLNFDPSDKVIFIGRIGCGITTLFALPINLLPCREALLSLMVQIGEFQARTSTASKVEEQKHLMALRAERSRTSSTMSDEHCEPGEYDSIRQTALDGSNSKPMKQTSRSKSEPSPSRREKIMHRAATVGILSICYVAAVLVPGIAIVWDFSGSSMAFLVQFIIPAVCYIRLKIKVPSGGRVTKHLVQAWVLLVVAAVGAVLCTAVTFRNYVP